MLVSLKRLMYALSNKINKHSLNVPERKITIDLSGKNRSPFDIKSESSYNANLSKGSLELRLKRSNYIAWVDIPGQEFQDHVIEAKIRLDSLGGYAAAGIIFHIMNDSTYYLALVSSKGYFRIDAVENSSPRPLIAWTEISDFDGNDIDLKIITYGANLIFLVNGKWLGETCDNSAAYGRLGFALASYSINDDEKESEEKYTCVAYLDSFSIDTRIKSIEDCFRKWTDDLNINANERLRFTETLAVMGESSKALEQLNRAWKRRDEAISSVATTYTEVRTRKELLLASRLSFSLGNYSEAEMFIDSLLELGAASAICADSTEVKLAYTEKIKILNELNRFEELKQFVITHPFKINKDIDFYTLTARCYWELKEYKNSAEAWDKSFELESENGVYAANAANAHELAGNKKGAVARYITAGKIFLNQGNNAELEALIPKLLSLGKRNWEAHILAGKWAFSIEDYDKSNEEFSIAHKLRSNLLSDGKHKPRKKADPAAYYLWALVLHIKEKNKDAITLLEKAVELAPDYGLFRFKLAEIKIKSGIIDTKIAEEFKLAFKHLDNDQLDAEVSVKDMANYAGKLLQSAGDTKNAKYFFNMANEEQ